MAIPSDIIAQASAAQSSDGASASVDLGVRTTVELVLAVTVASGTTPILTVVVEHSDDETLWATLGTFAAVSAAGRSAIRLPGALRYVRVRWTLGGGSPSFTFGVRGRAHFVLATPTELTKFGVAPAVVAGFSAEDQDRALDAATGMVLARMQRRFPWPWSRWGDDLRRIVSHIATYDLLCRRGFNSDQPIDKQAKERYDAALEELDSFADGLTSPEGFFEEFAPGPSVSLEVAPLLFQTDPGEYSGF